MAARISYSQAPKARPDRRRPDPVVSHLHTLAIRCDLVTSVKKSWNKLIWFSAPEHLGLFVQQYLAEFQVLSSSQLLPDPGCNVHGFSRGCVMAWQSGSLPHKLEARIGAYSSAPRIAPLFSCAPILVLPCLEMIFGHDESTEPQTRTHNISEQDSRPWFNAGDRKNTSSPADPTLYSLYLLIVLATRC